MRGEVAHGSVNYQISAVEHKPKVVVHAVFLIDASGSMAGQRMQTTLKYVEHTAQSVFSATDRVTVFLFSEKDKFTQLYSNTHARNITYAGLTEKVKCGGGTRLYDNVVRAFQHMCK